MTFECKTRKSHYWNEDRFIMGTNFFMVIDGATPLKKNGKLNEACWMVDYIKKNIDKLDGDIKTRLIQLAKDGYQNIPIENKSEEELPSASIAWVEFDDEYCYANVLGDCEVTIVTNDNQIIRCNTTRLDELDHIAIQQMEEIAEKNNIHIIDARPLVNETLIKHRKMINKPNGYSAFTLCENLEINEKSYKMKKEFIKEIYIYSDGFAQSFTTLHIYNNHSEMFSQSLNISDEINKIVKTASADKYCDQYPRFKVIDDITVIKIMNT